jgi:hypothetical protein
VKEPLMDDAIYVEEETVRETLEIESRLRA